MVYAKTGLEERVSLDGPLDCLVLLLLLLLY